MGWLVLKLKPMERVLIGSGVLRLDDLRQGPKPVALFSIDRNDGRGFRSTGWINKQALYQFDSRTTISPSRIGVTCLKLAISSSVIVPISRIGAAPPIKPETMSDE